MLNRFSGNVKFAALPMLNVIPDVRLLFPRTIEVAFVAPIFNAPAVRVSSPDEAATLRFPDESTTNFVAPLFEAVKIS